MKKQSTVKYSDQIFAKLFDLPRVKEITCRDSVIDFLIRLILWLIKIGKILFLVNTQIKILGEFQFQRQLSIVAGDIFKNEMNESSVHPYQKCELSVARNKQKKICMRLHLQGTFLFTQAHITERLLPFHNPDPNVRIMIVSVFLLKTLP